MPRPTTEGPDGPAPVDSDEDLQELFQAHSARIYRIAYRITGNPSDAEDVLQTIFLRLLRREETPDLSRSAGSYLHRAAVNAGLDLLRSRRRSRSVPLEAEDDDGVAPAPQLEATHYSAAAESRLERSELRDLLRQALAQLNPRSAEVFALRYFEGYGNTEIAEMLGTSRSSIGVTLHRSRERLKEQLGCLVGA
jgi:RNA polymerase sigma-70 factor (ECF subfamily)